MPALRFERLTRFYDPVVAWTTRERTFKRSLLDQADLDRATHLLDLGCGTGTLALDACAPRPSLTVVGIDGDPDMLDQAQAKRTPGSGDRLVLSVAYAESLPFPDACFDRVISSLFFHHLGPSSKRAALAEVFRVLKPGGELHVADWGRPTGWVMRAAAWPLRLFDGLDNTRDNVEGRLPELMANAGLADARVRSTFSTVFGTMTLYSARRP